MSDKFLWCERFSLRTSISRVRCLISLRGGFLTRILLGFSSRITRGALSMRRRRRDRNAAVEHPFQALSYEILGANTVTSEMQFTMLSSLAVSRLRRGKSAIDFVIDCSYCLIRYSARVVVQLKIYNLYIRSNFTIFLDGERFFVSLISEKFKNSRCLFSVLQLFALPLECLSYSFFTKILIYTNDLSVRRRISRARRNRETSSRDS